jgi:AcrR family transcriptional regulator
MRAFARFHYSLFTTCPQPAVAVARSSLRPRKSPRQARAAAMVDVIVQAAARVLSRESLAGFNTNRVAEVAGISIGSLYQYFPNKAALVAVLIEREQRQLAEAVEQCAQASAGQTLAQTLADLIDIAVDHQFGRAAFAAALDHEEQRLPLQAVLGATQQRIVIAVHGVLKRHHRALASPPSALAAADCLTITKAMVESAAQHNAPDLQALKRRVLQALQGYLLYRPPRKA